MHKTDLVAMGSWVGIAFVLWVVAWVVAMAIPVFNELLSLIVSISPSFLRGYPTVKDSADHAKGFPFRKLVYLYVSILPSFLISP